MRRAAVSGSFYEATFDRLDKQIKESFLSKLGPGELPITKRKGRILGAICPHAGYAFSGPCAAWAYKEIAESIFPDLFIVIGPNHYGGDKASTTSEDFETPLGIVKTDTEFAKKIGLAVDNESHAAEHSVEVQLPFMQFANKDHLNNIKFVPILVSQDTNYKKIGMDIKEAVVESGKNVCVIASSDFTHYGHNYGYVPFSIDVKKRMYELDAGAIKFIKDLDADGFIDYCYETGATICGQVAIATLLKSIKAKTAKLLRYYTSGDVTKDYKMSVGYASIVLD